MENIYIVNLNQKKQNATLVYKSPEKLNNHDVNEIIQWLRSELNIRGQERVKNELRGFLKSVPVHSYAKFFVKLDHDAHVLNAGGGGCLGYVSDHIIDYYDTLDFSQVEILTPSNPSISLDVIKEKFQIQTLFQIKNTPHVQPTKIISSTTTAPAMATSPTLSSTQIPNQFVAKFTARTPVVKTKTPIISPQILGTKA